MRSLFGRRRQRPAPPSAWPELFVPEETAVVPEEEVGRALGALAELRRGIGHIPPAFVGFPDEPRGWVPQDERFDANRYFAVFDRLRPDAGWVLDYIYHFWGNGGQPLLYARRAGDAPLESYAAYSERFAGAKAPYLDHLAAERSAAGAFQLALFALEAQKFYLHWHSHSFDTETVGTEARREEILSGIPEEGAFHHLGAIPAADRERLRALPVLPAVRRAGDFAEVETLAFTKWGGFFRRTTRLAFPNRLLAEVSEEVVPYQCGIVI